MSSNVLIEELGPRGRRRVRIGTGVAIALAMLIVYWMFRKLDENNQLEAARWTDLFSESTLRFLGEGLVATIRAAVTAGIAATAVGFGLALLGLSKSRLARMFSVGWVELFRALPLLLMIFGVFFIDTSIARGRGGEALLGTFWSVVVALILYNSAVLSEIFRAGVRSLDSGQSEAAKAIGMSYWQMMFVVVLPQAVRRMVPAIVAQMATLTKDVSLGFVIGYEEFVRRGAGTPNFGDTDVTNFQAYVSIGIVYFILVWALARLARWLDERQSRAPKTAGPSDLDDNLEVGVGDTLGAGPA